MQVKNDLKEVVSNTRDVKKWPFSTVSIWNMPIGSGAKYVNARLEQETAQGMTIDEDIIVMENTAPVIGNNPWARDMIRIFLNLYVVINNSEGSKGGGGEPLASMAPPLCG